MSGGVGADDAGAGTAPKSFAAERFDTSTAADVFERPAIAAFDDMANVVVGTTRDTRGNNMSREAQDRFAAAVAHVFHIEREIGRGGMAVVYLARDRKHDRPVAIKVLRPELTAAVDRARMVREIRLTARLQHPHIVPVLDSGDADGTLWFAMPYVAGESLRARLGQGPVPVAEAVAILRDIAGALAYAHAQRVVHRDIKPENVLLSSGTAVVTDFGIAKALAVATTRAPASGARGTGDGTLTEVGASLGTPAYMAPEQVVGDAAVDHRADLYALGVLAYELLAGTHPFAGRVSVALLAAHLTEMAPPLGGRRPEVPGPLAALVHRMLAKQPADRPPSAEQVLRDLELLDARTGGDTAGRRAMRAFPHSWRGRATLTAIALLSLGGTGLIARARFATGGTIPIERESVGGTAAAPVGIAILPFETRGPTEDGGARDEYFAEGLADAIRSQLAQLPELTVIDGRSAGQYKGTRKSVREIGRELGVPYVLQGSVQWARGADGVPRVQVSPALVRVEDAATIWAVPSRPEPSDVFQAQAQVAAHVAAALDVRLGHRERAQLERRPTSSPDAYEAYLRGLALFQRASFNPMLEGAEEAAAAFARAVELDPSFGLAWAKLAAVRVEQWNAAGDGDPTRLARARAALDSATRLVPELPETHVARARLAAFTNTGLPGVIGELRAAYAARPSDAEVLGLLGATLYHVPGGPLAEGLSYMVRAAELDPRTPEISARAARALSEAGRYADAIRYGDRVLALAPNQFEGYSDKALTLIASGAGAAAARAVLDSGVAQLGATAVMRGLVRRWWNDASGMLGSPYESRLEALTLAEYSPVAYYDTVGYYTTKAKYWRRKGRSAQAMAYCDSARAVVTHVTAGLVPRVAARRGLVSIVVPGPLAQAYACLGRRTDALRWSEPLRAAERDAADTYQARLAAAELANVYVYLGEPDSAVSHLERAVVPPTPFAPGYLRLDPFFAPLRGRPRFEALLARAPR